MSRRIRAARRPVTRRAAPRRAVTAMTPAVPVGETGGRRAALIGALVGTLYMLIAWGGLSWLTSPYWSTLGFPDSNDIASGVAATAHFIRAPWEFPLFSVPTFVFESGPGIVVQTNAMPLMALVAKLVYPLIGEINAMGLWQLIVPILQGAAAAWAAAQMGASRLGVVGAALIATGYGHFTQKMAVHPMLATHALPILILGLGAGIARGRLAPGRAAAVALAIPGIALLSNPYLAAMCLPIAAATAWAAVRAGLSVRRAVLTIAGGAALFGAILLIGGYTRMPYEGGRLFGLWSANVLGLFVPHAAEPPYGELWTWIPHVAAAPDQQHDSGIWIGLGGWLVLLVALVRLRLGGLRSLVRRHLPLTLAVVAIMIFSWSQRIYVGETMVAEIPLPERVIDLVDPFRWSGRFAWVPAYALLLGGAAAASGLSTVSARLARPGRRAALLGSLLVVVAGGLQWATAIDGEMGTAHLYRDSAPISPERRTQETIVAGSRTVHLFPSYFCGERRYDPNNWDSERLAQESFIYFGIAAGRAGASIDAMQIARGYDRGFGPGTSGCPDYQRTVADVATAIAADGSTVILFGADAKAIAGRTDLAGRCLALPSYVACPASRQLPTDDWATRAGLPIAGNGLPLINTALGLGDPRLGALLGFADGWERRISTEELWRTWRPETRSDPRLDEAAYPPVSSVPATIRFAVDDPRIRAFRLTIRAGTEGASFEGQPDLIAGATMDWESPVRCTAAGCAIEAPLPLLRGSIELIALAPLE